MLLLGIGKMDPKALQLLSNPPGRDGVSIPFRLLAPGSSAGARARLIRWAFWRTVFSHPTEGKNESDGFTDWD